MRIFLFNFIFSIALGKISETKKDVVIKMEPMNSTDEYKIYKANKLHATEQKVYEAIGLGNVEAEKWNVPTVYFIGKILNDTYHVVVMTRLDIEVYKRNYKDNPYDYQTVFLIILHSVIH